MPELLSLPVATLYAELHDQTQYDALLQRRVGGFSVKEIRGRRYWYHQRWVGRRRIQKAVGPESAEVLERIRDWRAEAREWRSRRQRRQQLVRSLRAALGMTTDRISSRVLRQLSDAGVFEAGGILIGTHAYMTYGPMLGMRLAASNVRTTDIDFAVVDLAIPDRKVRFSEAVQAAERDFFVVPPAPGTKISTALKYKGGETRVELLTPLKSGKPWQPVFVRSLDFGAQKVPYLDYLIDEPVEATYLADDGIRVRVPQPARFALHKLIVAANRGAAEQAKAAKDKTQSAELISALDQVRPGDLRAAVRALKDYPVGYRRKIIQSAQTMLPPLRDRLAQLLD